MDEARRKKRWKPEEIHQATRPPRDGSGLPAGSSGLSSVASGCTIHSFQWARTPVAILSARCSAADHEAVRHRGILGTSRPIGSVRQRVPRGNRD